MFSTLDMAHAYQQIPPDEASKELATINTAEGLYHCTPIPLGYSPFQQYSRDSWKVFVKASIMYLFT